MKGAVFQMIAHAFTSAGMFYLAGVLYEVRVAPHSGGGETRFEFEQAEPVKEGDYIPRLNMVYQATRVLPGHGAFDAVVEAEWRAGPAQAQSQP